MGDISPRCGQWLALHMGLVCVTETMCCGCLCVNLGMWLVGWC